MNTTFTGYRFGDAIRVQSSRRSGWLVVAMLIDALALLLASYQVIAGEEHESFFVEPGTGGKVTHYSIELPIRGSQDQAFLIPDDCAAVMQAIDQGSAYKGSVVARRYWQKAESDCHYDGYLHFHPQRIMEDYVSDYDFMNARISDLPLDRGCSDDTQPGTQSRCSPAAIDVFGMPRRFPLTAPISEAQGDIAESACELQGGVFHGRIYLGAEGIRCAADPRSPGMRLIAVDFADVNGDHFLDAVLRFVPLGPGASRTPLILPLTRKGPDEPFAVPEAQFPAPPAPPAPPLPPARLTAPPTADP